MILLWRYQHHNGQGQGKKSAETLCLYASAAARLTARHSLNWLLGGKGANLAEMASLGLPVPPGMTITTEVCSYYDAHEQRNYPTELTLQVQAGLKKSRKLWVVASAIQSNHLTFRSLRRTGVNARHDGHRAQPGT